MRITKAELKNAERDYAEMLLKYGPKNQAALNAEARYRELKEQYNQQKRAGRDESSV